MSDVLQTVLAILIGGTLIYFPLKYSRMEKVRFIGQMCVQRMDEGLLDWIETAAELVPLGGGDPAEYARVAEAFRETKVRKTAEKVRLANEAYAIVKEAAEHCAADPRARKILASLSDIWQNLSFLAEEHGRQTGKFNELLGKGSGRLFGAVFRVRPEPVLEDLGGVSR